PPGTVVMAAVSASRGGNQVFRVPLLDPAAQQSSTGGYPWYIDETSATVVYVKNVTDQPQEYVLELSYPGGAYTLGLRTVEAGQTAVVDIRQLRDSQVADEHGQTIPVDGTSGQVHWSLRGPEELVLIGRAEQADLAKGLSSSYACQNCCGDSFYQGSCLPNPVIGIPGSTNQFRAEEQDKDCFGNLRTPFSVSPSSWSSDNTTVATINASGLATAQGPGSANITARWTAYVRYYGGYPAACITNTITPGASALCSVARIDAISPPTLNVSTGDAAAARTLSVDFFPTNLSVLMTFHVTFLSNAGGTSQASLAVPSQTGFTPITTTVKASPADGSGSFVVRPGVSGQVSLKQSRVVVPPQVLLQMMRSEARGLPSSTVRILLGWSMRNRFNDSQYFPGQTTYQAAIAADATRDTTLLTGEQPELNDAVSVFDGFLDVASGSQGFWSPTESQWATVRTLFGTTTMPDRSATGIPFFYGGDRTRTQIVYFSSVGTNDRLYPGRGVPTFLFVRKRQSSQPAAVQIN
ncbi:MAG TPA: Ig-like domain-containing protein, partial [Blastocatellia bacterium]|nr:Ig-like domain-containing protein [Blastocatellia bacterium]